jgi:phage host-nuclease inhibitor protein Gam
MKKTRIRSIEKTIVSREEAESFVNDIALSENRRRVLAAEMDDKILAIREAYTPALDQCGADIKTKSALVQAWAEANPDEFSKKKHVDFFAGKVGFRTGTPKLKCVTGWTFARVLEKLLSVKWGLAWVRVKEEIDKEGIIASFSNGTLQPGDLREIGVKIEQDEAFFIEPNLAIIQDRLVREAA